MKAQKIILGLLIFMPPAVFAQNSYYVGTTAAANAKYEAEVDDSNQDFRYVSSEDAPRRRQRSNIKTVRTKRKIKTAARYYNPRELRSRGEGQSVATVSEWNTEAEFLNRLSVDLAPLINEGVGASYERVIMSKFTIGAYGNMYKLTNDQTKELGSKNDIMSFGLKGRYFINGNADESAFYLMGGAQSTTLKTEVDANREFRKNLEKEGQVFLANSFLFSGEKKMTREVSEIGGVVGAGYQIAGNAMDNAGFLIDIGGFYGHGNAAKYQVKTINNGTQTELTSEIKYDFFAELSVGIMF